MSNSKSYIEVSEIVGMAGYTALTALMVGTGIRHEGITRNPNERGRIRNLERTFHD